MEIRRNGSCVPARRGDAQRRERTETKRKGDRGHDGGQHLGSLGGTGFADHGGIAAGYESLAESIQTLIGIGPLEKEPAEGAPQGEYAHDNRTRETRLRRSKEAYHTSSSDGWLQTRGQFTDDCSRERTCSLVKSKQEATGSIDVCNMKVASTFPWAVAPNDDCGQTRQARVYPKGVQAALRLLRNHHRVRCDGNARTERTVGSDWSDAVNHDPVHAEGRRLYKSAATTCAAQSISSLGDAASP